MQNNTQQQEDVLLTNVSALLQQLGEQIDARERQLQEKVKTEYQRNEQVVNNTIMNLFSSIGVLMKEAVKRALYRVLKQTSNQLKGQFDISTNGSLAFVAQGTQEQEDKQNEITVQTLTSTQSAWREALKATQPPDASVETHLMNQAQDTFKKLDCHRRVLVVALQTYQTNHLQAEIQFIENVYNIKTRSIRALWQRLQHLVQQYKQDLCQIVAVTVDAIHSIQQKQQENSTRLANDVQHFVSRLKKLWGAYKVNSQLVDDTSSEANDVRVAIDTLLSGTGAAAAGAAPAAANSSMDFLQAADLLQKHWQLVAQHINGCTVTGKKSTSDKVALQKNADKMLFCAKNRAQVLQNAKAYRNTSEWIQALKKWDAAMKQLELEAQVLRKEKGISAAEEPALCDSHNMIVAHRQWKRLVFALAPLAKKLQEQQRQVQTQESTMYAVLLNKVGYELKRGLDHTLQKQATLEKEHSDLERAQVEVEENNFKLLHDKYENDSRYMTSELQSYGDSANKCRELITKLFQLKVWQEHANHLKQQLEAMQPLVVQVSKFIEME